VVNFILREGDYQQLPKRLLRNVPGFEASNAFQVVAADRDLPGVVCAALARYLIAAQRQAMTGGEAGAELRRVLRAIYEAIEDLATSEDPETQNVVVVDILETLAGERDIREVIKRNLLPKSRELYDRWVS